MRDMVPREQRSIRDIPVPNHGRKHITPTHGIEENFMEPSIQPRRRGRSRLFLIVAIVVVAICGIAGFLLSTLFAGATITVFPRQETVQAPATLVAHLKPEIGELGFQIVTVTRSASTTVTATGTHDVSRSASGLITIYNSYDAESQRLIANTRFEAPDGKIYRIHDSVVVPGIQGQGSSATPGSASVTVYADSPGTSYNRGETRFTIPGFKNDPRYEKFYATTIGVTGGFVGTEPAVAQADLTRANDTLKTTLSQAAQSELASQIPAGYSTIPGTLEVVFGNLSQSPGQGNTAIVSQTATMTGAIVSVGDLAAAIAKEKIAGYGGEAVGFVDTQGLSVASATSTSAGKDITLSLSGSPVLLWQFDPGALKTALVGKSKAQFQTIIQSFEPAITRAEAKVRPFWERNFPSNGDKIEIVTGN